MIVVTSFEQIPGHLVRLDIVLASFVPSAIVLVPNVNINAVLNKLLTVPLLVSHDVFI